MAFPIIPLAIGGAALAWLAFRKKPEGDALDAAARDGAGGGGDGKMPPPPPPPPPSTIPGGSRTTPLGKVRTPPTATPGRYAIFVNLVEPAVQPKIQSAENQTRARSLASPLYTALLGNADGSNYAPNPNAGSPGTNSSLVSLVKQFQTATGIIPDGLYGPVTAGALFANLSRPPPAPFFYPGRPVDDVYIAIFRPHP